MPTASPVRISAKDGVTEQHVEILRLTKDLAGSDEKFCQAMTMLGCPVDVKDIQQHPVPVMACMRVAAAKVCGLGGSSFFSIVTLQLQFSGLIQDLEVRSKLGIEWEPDFYAGTNPTRLTDSIEQNATREKTLALVDELISRIQ